MRYRWLIVSAVLAGCAATDKRVTPAPVVAAERAFAADGAKRGWAAAFRSYAAPEAIMLNPDPVNAHESLAKIPGRHLRIGCKADPLQLFLDPDLLGSLLAGRSDLAVGLKRIERERNQRLREIEASSHAIADPK